MSTSHDYLNVLIKYSRKQAINDAIRTELEKYSWRTLREFQDKFPCAKSDSEVFWLEIFALDTDPANGYVETVYYTSEEEFWNRWNKFKNLRAFL